VRKRAQPSGKETNQEGGHTGKKHWDIAYSVENPLVSKNAKKGEENEEEGGGSVGEYLFLCAAYWLDTSIKRIGKKEESTGPLVRTEERFLKRGRTS